MLWLDVVISVEKIIKSDLKWTDYESEDSDSDEEVKKNKN